MRSSNHRNVALRRAAVLLMVVFGVLAVAASGESGNESGSSKGSDTSTGPEQDVTVTGCEVDSVTNFAKATVDVTNNSSKDSTYFIEVKVESEDGSRSFGIANVTIQRLSPDQTITEEASTLQEAEGEITCTVADVTRTAAF